MILEGLNYYSGNVPGGVWLLFGLLAVTWFVLWFVYHFSGILRPSRFWFVGLTVSLFWLLAYTFFWQRFPPPLERQRILILPQSNPDQSSQFQDLYLRGIQIYEFLRIKTSPNEFLVYHPDWILAAADWDSMARPSYQEKLMEFMAADYVLQLAGTGSEAGLTADLIEIDHNHRSTIPGVVQSADGGLQMDPAFLHIFAIDTSATHIYGPKWDLATQRIWAAARLSLLQGDAHTAQKQLQAIVQRYDDFYPALFDLTQIQIDSALIMYTNEGQAQAHLTKAAQYLEVIRERDLRDPRALRLRGEYALLSKSFVQAEGRLKESFFLDRDDDRLYLDLARLHPSRYRVLKFLKEESLLRRAIFINPASILARVQYSDYLSLIHQPQESKQIIQDMLAVFPNQVSLRMALGRLYISHERYADAVAIFAGMLDTPGPNQSAVKFNLAVSYYHDTRSDEAKKILEELENVNPDAYLYLAYIHEKQGDIKQAVAYLRKRIRNNQGPDDRFKEEARKHLVKLLNEFGDPEE